MNALQALFEMTMAVSKNPTPSQSDSSTPSFEEMLQNKSLETATTTTTTTVTDTDKPTTDDTELPEEAGLMEAAATAVLQNATTQTAPQILQNGVQIVPEEVQQVQGDMTNPVVIAQVADEAPVVQPQTGTDAMPTTDAQTTQTEPTQVIPTAQTDGQAHGQEQSEAGEGSGQNLLPDDAEVLDTLDTGPKALFKDTQQMPTKVGDGATLDTTSTQFESKLSSQILTAAQNGQQQVVLQLTPENLGKVVVELNLQGGILNVVLQVENESALRLLTDQTATLGNMLQSSGQEVRVQVTQADGSEQPWQHPDQEGGNKQQQERQRQDTPQEAEDFLQKLRLGLFQNEIESA